jgi:predicted nucleic acid-binding protein
MYRALKNTQLEIADTLMKFADEITTNSQPSSSATNTKLLEAFDAMNKKHDAQYSMLVAAIDRLNSTLQKHLTAAASASQPAVITSSTIPSLNPVANPADMLSSVKTVHVQAPVTLPVQHVVEEAEVSEVEVEVEEEAEVEVEEEAEVEVVEEVEVEEEVEEEAEVEVEEWTYKGMSFFKDSNNVVYSNDNGDVGEPIGKYDPLKKVLKKLQTTS